MRRKFLLLSAVVLLGLSGAAALADAISDARKTIQAHYAMMCAAFARQDFPAYGQFYTEDFTAILYTGDHLNKQEALKNLAAKAEFAKPSQMTITITNFFLKDNTAQVAVFVRSRSRVIDPETKQDLVHIIRETSELFTWVQTAQGWRIRQVKDLRITLRQEKPAARRKQKGKAQ